MIAVAVLAVVVEIRKGYFKGFPAYLRSVSFRKDRFVMIALVLATVGMLWADSFLRHQIQGIQIEFVKSVFAFGGFVGKKLWNGLVFLYLAAFLLRQEKWQRLFFGVFLTGATTGLLAGVLKFTFLRARPDLDLGPFSFFHLEGLTKDNGVFQSFPSGDVAIVAGAAAYLVCALKNYFLKGLIFLIPLATAFSRVALNDHWPSDVLFSFGLSCVAARFWWEFKRVQI